MKPKTVDDYLTKVPEEQRVALDRLRKQIKAAAPKIEERIGYGMPYYKQNGPVAYIVAHKNHCSLYLPGDSKNAFKQEIAPYHTSKATLRFTPEKPLPATLVKKLIKARIAENEVRHG